jgi:hypothetical protein
VRTEIEKLAGKIALSPFGREKSGEEWSSVG